LQQPGGGKWHQQLNIWEKVVKKFGIDSNRCEEFKYLLYMNIDDYYVKNYVKFQLGVGEVDFKHRLSRHVRFWVEIGTPDWLLRLIELGVEIPFENRPPRMILQNSRKVLEPQTVPIIRNIIREYLGSGFVKKVDNVPYCVLPLQVKVTSDKTALIYDMSPLNEYVEKSKFKLESWEEMLDYSRTAQWAIKFDLKKFYHEIDIHPDFQKYFGFMYQMEDGQLPDMFVWSTMPYGYTRAPFIARQLMKPLVNKWRKVGAKIVVFYDDGMVVSSDQEELRKLSVLIQCDLINAGLIPGVGKCIWDPMKVVDWNGLRFDFLKRGISILPRRIDAMLTHAQELLGSWPGVSFRQVSKLVGQLMSMHPVLGGLNS
jgi:Reverse transcriptase (RNA-dependent DNA polymerase)